MSNDATAFVKSIQESMNLPRDNGELVFQTPWQGRVFAMAVIMMEKGVYPWTSFNGKFAGEIGEAEREHPEMDVAAAYYQLWVKALEKVLVEHNAVSPQQIDERVNEFVTGQRHSVC